MPAPPSTSPGCWAWSGTACCSCPGRCCPGPGTGPGSGVTVLRAADEERGRIDRGERSVLWSKVCGRSLCAPSSGSTRAASASGSRWARAATTGDDRSDREEAAVHQVGLIRLGKMGLPIARDLMSAGSSSTVSATLPPSWPRRAARWPGSRRRSFPPLTCSCPSSRTRPPWRRSSADRPARSPRRCGPAPSTSR